MSGVFFIGPEDAEQHRQAHKSAAHDINSLLDTLGENDLRVLGMIFDGIAVSDDPIRLISYLGGRVTAVQQYRFNICSACGENHDEQLGDMVADAAEKPEMPEVPPFVAARREAEANEIQFTPPHSTADLSRDEVDLMNRFSLDDVRDADTNELLGFVCEKCEFRYANLQDRIYKPEGVEGCRGCIQKAKWG